MKLDDHPQEPYKKRVSEGKGDPCWDSHKQVGMKKKGGRLVPNCVPKEELSIDQQMKISRDAAKEETLNQITRQFVLRC